MRSILLLSAVLLAAPGAAQDMPATPLTVPPPPAQAQAPGGAPPPLEVSVTGGISAPMPIAIPTMPTDRVTDTQAGSTDALGKQLADIVTSDLKSSGLFNPLPPAQLRTVMFPEVTQPAFSYWGGSGAQALVQCDLANTANVENYSVRGTDGVLEVEQRKLRLLRGAGSGWEVIDTGLADVVLLDNMDIAELAEAVKIAHGRVVLEASGGVTEDTVAAIAKTGVDYASSGALTHSAPNFDVALDIET